MKKSILVQCIVVIIIFTLFGGCKSLKPKLNETQENSNASKINESAEINDTQLNSEKKSADDAEKNKADYTKESWDEYHNDLKKALAMPEKTADEKKAKAEAIRDALKKLVKLANKNSLDFQKKALENAEKDKSSFTSDSWEEFQKALQKALLMPETTDAEIEAKIEAIENAFKKLVKGNQDSKTALESEKKSATDIAKYKVIYTSESWADYQKALQDALLMPETTEDEIKAKTLAIQDALKKLIKISAKKALDSQKKATTEVNKEKSTFTAESWDDYQKALQEALLMPETTDEEIKAKTQAIQDALKKLIKETTKNALEDEKKATNEADKEKSSFTTESWDEYQKALQKALLMPETTEEEIKAKTAAILDALKKLIKETSKKTLETEKKSIKDADKEKSIFTTESWDDYQKALQEALLMPETTEEEMKAKTTAIQNALKKLIKQTTQSTLETEKKTTKDTEKEKSSFTAESWDDYQKALQKALLMPETTEEEIQAKTEAIKNALKKLIKSENKNALDAVKKSTTDIEKNKNDYTPDSWNAFQEALKAALALPETTDEEVRIKSEAIKNAMKKLIIDSTKKKTETGTNFIAVNNDFKGEIDMSTGSLTVTYYADTTQILGSVPIDNYYYPTKGTVVVRNNIGNLAGKEIRDGIRQRFIKWNSKPDGSGTDFLPGYSFQIVENTQFYAIFTTGNDVLRKVGVGGGWVFYDAGSKQSWGRYLEAANEDVTSSAWGKSNLIVKGADGIAIGTGQQNTIDIINSDAAEINKAADICYAYTTTFCGKTIDDWFLPSKDELNMLYLNLGRGRDENDVVYTIPAGITNGYYWSSSESDDRLAWLHYFKFGKQHAYYKQSAQGVRPIRAF